MVKFGQLERISADANDPDRIIHACAAAQLLRDDETIFS